MMRLIDALTQHSAVSVFAVLDSDSEDKSEWGVEPIDASVLTESEVRDFFIVQAKHILPDGTIADCHIDLCLPERISDYAYFRRDDRVDFRYHHECDGEIICAVPIDCFGVYDLFYSRTSPNIGVDVLRKGLAESAHKTYIAEDLGYILRDERRFAEAAEMFQISVDGEPSSYFIYGELAACYDEIGHAESAKKYHELFRKSE